MMDIGNEKNPGLSFPFSSSTLRGGRQGASSKSHEHRKPPTSTQRKCCQSAPGAPAPTGVLCRACSKRGLLGANSWGISEWPDLGQGLLGNRCKTLWQKPLEKASLVQPLRARLESGRTPHLRIKRKISSNVQLYLQTYIKIRAHENKTVSTRPSSLLKGNVSFGEFQRWQSPA